MDTNKDGKVSKEEYMKMQEKKFDAMDTNKDKMLSQEEWTRQQLDKGSGGGADSTVHAIFESYDRGNDICGFV